MMSLEKSRKREVDDASHHGTEPQVVDGRGDDPAHPPHDHRLQRDDGGVAHDWTRPRHLDYRPAVDDKRSGVGQALAYTVSTTGGLSAVPEAKAGVASGILSMVRLLGAVFGVTTTGALFKAMENGKLTELLAASGANLDASDRAEIRGLLSGSAAAEQRLSRFAPAATQSIERVVREAFVHALDGAMLLCMFVSVAGVLASFLVAGKAARPQQSPTPAPESPTPQTGKA